MEKYTQWRDSGTGIAPFLPIKNSLNEEDYPLYRKVIEFILSTVSGILRLPLIVGASSTYFLLVRHVPVGNFIDRCWIWLLLGLSGAWFWDIGIEGVRKGRVGDNREKLPKPGDLIISNFISPIDVFAYAATFNPLFALPIRGPHGEDEFVLTPIWKIALISLSCKSSWPYLTTPDHELGASLEQVVRSAKKNNRCLVLFGEATTSNGRGLLHFPNQLQFDELPSKSRIFPVVIKLNPPSLTTPIPSSQWVVVNLAKWLWSLASLYRGIHIRIRIANPISISPSQSSGQIQTIVIDSLCKLGRLRYLGPQLDEKAKQSFIATYHKLD